MKKNMIFTILSSLVFNGYAMTCDEAKDNMIKTTSEVKANHQHYSSFKIEQQQELLDYDFFILAKNDYVNSLSFYKEKCNSFPS